MSEARANRAWNNGDPGFYVVNGKTQIAVAGPYSDERAAAAEAHRRDIAWPDDPNKLKVYEVVS
jgi:hypothetical protein